MAFGGTIVPKLNLILSLICKEYEAERMATDPNFHMLPVVTGSENPQCQVPEIQALVSKFMLYINLLSGILSAIVSPKLGALSDRYGRKPMICCGTLGLLVNEAITIVIARYSETFSVYWILLGAIFDGLGGTFIAAMAISYAYASDCTAPNKRNVAFGYYHGCLFTGIALGPLVAGYVIKATGDILSIFYFAVGAHGIFLLWIIFVVPESLSKERQRIAREKLTTEDANNTPGHRETATRSALTLFVKYLRGGNVLAPLTILWPTEPGTNPQLRRNLFFLAAVDTTMFGVAMGSMTVVLLYAEYMFDWGNYETSIFVSIVNIGRVSVLVVLLPIALRLLRGPSSKAMTQHSGSDNIDLGIIRIAILFDLTGYIGYSTVRTGPLFILSGLISSVGGIGSPTLSSALTKHVPPERTGQVLGAMGLLHSSGRVVAPTVFNLIYARTVGGFTQTVFVCLAGAFGFAFIFSLFIRPHGEFLLSVEDWYNRTFLMTVISVHWDKRHIPTGSDDVQVAANRGHVYGGDHANEDDGVLR